MLPLSFFYFLFLFSRLRSFFSTQKRKPAKPIPLYFNYNSNPSISFAISLTALLAVQSVYSSAQATQWSYINVTRSPASLILALISAIFFSSSFFNSFWSSSREVYKFFSGHPSLQPSSISIFAYRYFRVETSTSSSAISFALWMRWLQASANQTSWPIFGFSIIVFTPFLVFVV